MINQKVAAWLVGDTDVMDNCFMLVSQRVDPNIAAACGAINKIKRPTVTGRMMRPTRSNFSLRPLSLYLCVSKFGPLLVHKRASVISVNFKITHSSTAINFAPPAHPVYLLFIIKLQPLVRTFAAHIIYVRATPSRPGQKLAYSSFPMDFSVFIILLRPFSQMSSIV